MSRVDRSCRTERSGSVFYSLGNNITWGGKRSVRVRKNISNIKLEKEGRVKLNIIYLKDKFKEVSNSLYLFR